MPAMKKKIQLISIFFVLLNNSCRAQEKGNAMKTVEDILKRQVDKDKTPGLQYYFFNKDSIIYSYLGGLADIEMQEKVTDKTTFNAYSVTKTFTALSILQLAEKGMLKLDDPVSKYLPNFPFSFSITIKQLLTHSSGIPNPLPLSWIHTTNEHSSFDSDAFFIEIFQEHNKTKSYPNEKFAYSNLGYVLLGMLIEQISGQNYTDYVTENIIEKIGLKSDHLDFTIQDTNFHSKGYHKNWSFTYIVLGFLLDKSKYIDKTEGKWKSFKNLYVNGPSYGGLIGTGSAFVTYLQELLKPNNRLISEDYKHQLFTENRLKNKEHTNMCISWFKGELNGQTYFAHAGGGGGYYCEIRLYPEPGKGSVIMFNRTGMSDERILDNIDKYLIDEPK
jgi:CubicO group peptidase (beta-lactamase class C family)